jgi:diacylglycerol kinase
MARKLGLALIVGGIIGAYAGFWNLNNASENSKKIRNELQYSQQGVKNEMEIERDPRIRHSAMYGGASAAGTLASIFAVAAGGYLFVKRKNTSPE